VYVCMCVCVYVCMCVCVYVCMCVCVYVCMCSASALGPHTYTLTHIHTYYAYTHICTHIHTYTYTYVQHIIKVLLLLSSVSVLMAEAKSKWNGSPKLRREKIIGPRAHEIMRVRDLPDNFDWRNVNGTNFLTESRNQHIPTVSDCVLWCCGVVVCGARGMCLHYVFLPAPMQYCGSCWAFGTLSSLNDRLKIANKGAYPEVILAPQVLYATTHNDSPVHCICVYVCVCMCECLCVCVCVCVCVLCVCDQKMGPSPYIYHQAIQNYNTGVQ